MADKIAQKQCPACPARVSRKGTFSRVSDKSVRQGYRTRLFSMIHSRYSTSMLPKSVEQVCPIRVSRKQCRSRASRKNVPEGCFPRVACKGALYKSFQTWEHSGTWVLSGFCLVVRVFCLVLLFGSFCVGCIWLVVFCLFGRLFFGFLIFDCFCFWSLPFFDCIFGCVGGRAFFPKCVA